MKELEDINKQELINALTNELPVLRAKIGISQDELSRIIGISRQTYSSIETKKREMSWSIFISLVLFFNQNRATESLIKVMGIYPDELDQIINVNRRNI